MDIHQTIFPLISVSVRGSVCMDIMPQANLGSSTGSGWSSMGEFLQILGDVGAGMVHTQRALNASVLADGSSTAEDKIYAS